MPPHRKAVERYMPFLMTVSNSKIYFLILLLTHGLLVCCKQNSRTDNFQIDTLKKEDTIKQTKETGSDTLTHKLTGTEDKIIDTIFSLKEVQDWAKYLETETKNKRHAQGRIGDSPTSEYPYYLIQVGEDNGFKFVAHFNFFVHSQTRQILFLDTVNDDTLTIDQWRKRNGM